ncbi:MAG: ABC transporter substrate-binding protein [Peptostreptococcaceae bacterium]|nr:ABC transporter substrate-binding protein [Peptostreptococcaceae bacterium]
MKRLKWKGLTAVLLAGMIALTGCGGDGGQQKPAEGDQPSTEEPATGEPETDLAKTAIDYRAAADPSMNPTEAANRKDTIIAGVTDFNGVFNPWLSFTVYDRYVNQMVFGEGITDNDDTGRPIDGIGSFTVSEDGKTYSIKINDDVNFSDGKPVTSDDFIFSYELLADPTYDGPSDIMKEKIVGVQEFKEGKADSISGIKKIDDKNFEITLEEPNAPFWAFLGTPALPKHYYGPVHKRGDMTAIHSLDAKPLGAGPYKLVEYKEGQSVTFEANDGYWRGTPKTKNVIFTVTSSDNSLQMVSSGAVDIQDLDVNEDNVMAVADAGFLDLTIFPTNGYGYMGFNVESNPMLADLKVRQALIYGTNRKDIVANVYGPYAKVLNVPQSRLSWSYTDEGVEPYDYDMEKAAALFAEAGYTKGSDGILEKDGKKFVINFIGTAQNPVVDAIIPVIAKDWKDLGVDLKVEFLDFPTLSDKVKKHTVDMWFMAWGLTADPHSAEETYTTGGGNNHYSFSSAKVDDLFDQARREIDQDKRGEIYREIYRELNANLPEILVYQRSDMWAVNSRIKGLEPSPYKYFTRTMWKAEIAE